MRVRLLLRRDENPKLLCVIPFLAVNVVYLHEFRRAFWTSSKVQLLRWINLNYLNLLCFVLQFCQHPLLSVGHSSLVPYVVLHLAHAVAPNGAKCY